MKKVLIALIFSSYCFFNFLSAQMIIPKFSPAEKLEVFSSEEEESMPLPFNNGTSIYFYRTYVEGSGNKITVTGQDIWFSKEGKKGWEKPYRLFREGDLEGQNSIIGTSSDGKRIYLFNTTYTGESSSRKLVYIDNEGKDKWTSPVEIKVPGLVYGEKYYSFYINPEETVILVSMSPSEENLDEDLFVSLKDSLGKWGELISLGNKVNSKRFEVAPYITDDLKTLYFSSNGHGGYGAADIFVSRRLDDSWQNWSVPLNLGEPINSNGYDAFFIMGNNREVYFTSSRNSEHSNIYKTVATGEFLFANADSLGGVFLFKGLPSENVTLIIEDLDGNLVDKIITDIYGRFRFEKLEGEENYIVRLDVEEDQLYVGSKIYFVDGNGVKTKRYIYTEQGRFVNSKEIKRPNLVKGKYHYEESPSMKSALEVTDENKFAIDTIYTDEKGMFTHYYNKYDNGFTIAPLNMEDDDFDNVSLFLTDDEGNLMTTLIPGEFHSLNNSLADNGELKEIEAKGGLTKSKKGFSSGMEFISKWNGKAIEDRTVYFDFNKTDLSSEEEEKLEDLIEVLKKEEESKVKLIGHTDNYGSSKSNMAVGLNRAIAVQMYLVSRLIPISRIAISTRGESSPIQSNESEEGKANNRRVEILLQ